MTEQAHIGRAQQPTVHQVVGHLLLDTKRPRSSVHRKVLAFLGSMFLEPLFRNGHIQRRRADGYWALAIAFCKQVPISDGGDQGTAFVLPKPPVLQDVANGDAFAAARCRERLNMKPVDFYFGDQPCCCTLVELSGHQGGQEAAYDDTLAQDFRTAILIVSLAANLVVLVTWLTLSV